LIFEGATKEFYNLLLPKFLVDTHHAKEIFQLVFFLDTGTRFSFYLNPSIEASCSVSRKPTFEHPSALQVYFILARARKAENSGGVLYLIQDAIGVRGGPL
jgi:hypothetical protein